MEVTTLYRNKISNNPTTKDKETYAAFFNTIRHVLPCIYCRNSFHEYITELPENYTIVERI